MKKIDLDSANIVDEILRAVSCKSVRFEMQRIHSANNIACVLYEECLARLPMEDGRYVSAGSFIPLLERQSKIAILDRYMIELVLDRLNTYPDSVLGCNVSVDTLTSVECWPVIWYNLLCQKENLNRLVLEVTETRPICNIDLISERLSEIRTLGCRIAIDDFGSGYFNTEQLMQLKVDIVKIDASIVNKAIQSGDKSLFHMIGLARCAAEIVVVEGIETVAHMENARTNGATHLQGYHLSMPFFPE